MANFFRGLEDIPMSELTPGLGYQILDEPSHEVSVFPVGKNDKSSSGKEESPKGCCQVEKCQAASLTFNHAWKLRRHWANVHERYLTQFGCLVEDCSYRHIRRDKVEDHAKRLHPNAFIDPEDQILQLKNLCEVICDNNDYEDPGNASPPDGYQRGPKFSKKPRVFKISANRRLEGETLVNQLNRPLPTKYGDLLKEYYLLDSIKWKVEKRMGDCKNMIKKEEQTRKRKLEEENMTLKREVEELKRKVTGKK